MRQLNKHSYQISPIITLIISIVAFLSIEPWIIWNTKILSYLYITVASILIIYYSIKQKFSNQIIAFFFVITVFSRMFGGLVYNEHEINSLTFATLGYLLLPNKLKLEIFTKFKSILVVVFSLGIIIYLLRIFIDINGFIIQPRILSIQCNYVCYLFEANRIDAISQVLHRFSSVFDEPGVVGTICGLLISIKKFNYKSFSWKIILFAGLISFSFAFYIILCINIIFNFNKNLKVAILIVILGLIANNIFHNAIENNIIKRFAIKDYRLVSNNRLDEVFDQSYNKFLSGDVTTVTFGIGQADLFKKDIIRVNVYKILVYKYGLAGVFTFICFFALATWFIAPTIRGWFFLTVFLLLAYQRPNVFDFFNIIIFFGGLISIRVQSLIENKSLSKTYLSLSMNNI